MELGLVSGLPGDSELCRRRRENALDARHTNLVRRNLLQLDILQTSRHITIIVKRSLDLIHQLRRHRSNTHFTARASLLLAIRGITIRLNRRNGEPEILAVIEEVLEPGVVATAGV